MSNAQVQKDPLGRSALGRAHEHGRCDRPGGRMRKPVDDAPRAQRALSSPRESISTMAEYASRVLSLCNNMGEGWLLTAEMLDLIRPWRLNIICTQPFACPAQPRGGQGRHQELRRSYPESNIVAVDYDPRRVRGQSAQSHQAHDLGGEARICARGKGLRYEPIAMERRDSVTSRMKPHHPAGEGR